MYNLKKGGRESSCYRFDYYEKLDRFYTTHKCLSIEFKAVQDLIHNLILWTIKRSACLKHITLCGIVLILK